ncbi:MAG: TonB-dependent receptor domain-containing protein, partial [Terriglobales bacterium]
MRSRRFGFRGLAAMALFVSIFALSSARAADPPDRTFHFNIPAGGLSQALRAFGQTASEQIIFTEDLVSGMTSKGLSADLPAEAALHKLLEGTGLAFQRSPTGVIMIRRTAVSPGSSRVQHAGTETAAQMEQAAAGPQASEDIKEGKKPTELLDEVVVTGTHIRDVQPAGSALKVYTRQDIEESGAGALDQFARMIPQNFSNTDSVSNFTSNALFSQFSEAANNISNSSAFNLHGLGPSATLTLLNGKRLSPSGSDGSLVDISQIPLSAIDHIEILSDGASAIYGADAVAGVVNIVTRKDFSGAETGARYGGATDGGADETTVSQLLGHSWSDGNVMLTYEYDKQGGLNASQRSYIPDLGGPFSLLPANRRNSAIISANQTFETGTTVSAQGIYSDRRTEYQQTLGGPGSLLANEYSGDAKQSGATISIEQALSGDWHVTVSGNYNKVTQDWNQHQAGTGFVPFTNQTIDTDSNLLEADAIATGALLSVPAGAVRVALGASFRKEQFGSDDVVDGASTPIPTTHRNVSSAFGEVAAPVVGSANAIPGVQRLDFSAAGRFDHYSDFGSTSNFKLGLAWEPWKGIAVKGTFGTSFQVPLLSQLSQPVNSYAYGFPDPTSPSGTTNTVFVLGGNSDLQPEKSRAYTIGADLKPAGLPSLQVSANYFHIDFEERIQSPPLVGLNLFVPLLTPFVTRNPPLGVVEGYFNSPGFFVDLTGEGPAAVTAIFNDRIANIAATTESGIDFNAAYEMPTAYGQYRLLLDVTHLFHNDYETVKGAPTTALLNDFGQPTKWRGRVGLSWSKGPFAATIIGSYVNSYQNSLFTPPEPVSSWTTGDFHLAYNASRQASSSFMRGFSAA